MLDFAALVSGMLLGTGDLLASESVRLGLESAVYIRFNLVGRGVFLSGDLSCLVVMLVESRFNVQDR